jgi:hypothetical protein
LIFREIGHCREDCGQNRGDRKHLLSRPGKSKTHSPVLVGICHGSTERWDYTITEKSSHGIFCQKPISESVFCKTLLLEMVSK